MRVLGKEHIMDKYGMLPTRWDLTVGEPIPGGGKPSNDSVSYDLLTGMRCVEQLSVGGAADSGHEYLLKLYLLTGKSDQASLGLC